MEISECKLLQASYSLFAITGTSELPRWNLFRALAAELGQPGHLVLRNSLLIREVMALSQDFGTCLFSATDFDIVLHEHRFFLRRCLLIEKGTV